MRAAIGFRCRRCGKRRPTYRIGRMGGGDYKRASRIYRSRICKPCADYLIGGSLARAYAGQRIGRWDGRTLRRIAAL